MAGKEPESPDEEPEFSAAFCAIERIQQRLVESQQQQQQEYLSRQSQRNLDAESRARILQEYANSDEAIALAQMQEELRRTKRNMDLHERESAKMQKEIAKYKKLARYLTKTSKPPFQSRQEQSVYNTVLERFKLLTLCEKCHEPRTPQPLAVAEAFVQEARQRMESEPESEDSVNIGDLMADLEPSACSSMLPSSRKQKSEDSDTESEDSVIDSSMLPSSRTKQFQTLLYPYTLQTEEASALVPEQELKSESTSQGQMFQTLLYPYTLQTEEASALVPEQELKSESTSQEQMGQHFEMHSRRLAQEGPAPVYSQEEFQDIKSESDDSIFIDNTLGDDDEVCSDLECEHCQHLLAAGATTPVCELEEPVLTQHSPQPYSEDELDEDDLELPPAGEELVFRRGGLEFVIPISLRALKNALNAILEENKESTSEDSSDDDDISDDEDPGEASGYTSKEQKEFEEITKKDGDEEDSDLDEEEAQLLENIETNVKTHILGINGSYLMPADPDNSPLIRPNKKELKKLLRQFNEIEGTSTLNRALFLADKIKLIQPLSASVRDLQRLKEQQERTIQQLNNRLIHNEFVQSKIRARYDRELEALREVSRRARCARERREGRGGSILIRGLARCCARGLGALGGAPKGGMGGSSGGHVGEGKEEQEEKQEEVAKEDGKRKRKKVRRNRKRHAIKEEGAGVSKEGGEEEHNEEVQKEVEQGGEQAVKQEETQEEDNQNKKKHFKRSKKKRGKRGGAKGKK